MKKRYDEILDECIDRILFQGASVEECLARYPEYAQELELQCRVVAQLSSASTLPVSTEAKDRGRLRLQAELRVLEQRDALKRVPARRRFSAVAGWRPRWAVAVATLALAVVFSGAGVAAAAGSSLPGDLLYPVKQATEQARLTMQFSDAGKATLHLSYAQRRAEETSTLVQRGDTSRLKATEEALAESISTATELAGRVEDKDALVKLRSDFESHSLQTLAVLQEALQSAPEGSRASAGETLKAASQVYGEAVETVGPRSASKLAASPGTLRLLATDPPPPNVEKVLVQVGEIRVRRIEEQGAKWQTITIPPQTFDLLKIAEVQTFLAELQIEAGTYTKIRFAVEKVTVVVGGIEYQAKVPGDDLVLTRPFQVEEGKTTTVLLDFNGLESLHMLGSGDYLITPQVKVLVQSPRHEEKERDGKGEKDKEGEGKQGARIEEKSPLVEIGGTIESKTDGSLVLRGKEVVVPPGAEVKDQLEVGGWAKVTGVFRPDGTFEVRKIEVEKKGKQDGEKEKDEEQDNADRGPGDGGSGKEQPSETTTRIEIEGVVESKTNGSWVIAGRTVSVTAQTEIRGQTETGVSVRVAGTIRADGSIVAERIVARPAEDRGGQEGKGDEGSSGKEPERPTPTPAPEARSSRLTGAIQAMDPGRWTVAGRQIIVDTKTRIDGQPALDVLVEVEGEEQANGAVLAKRIVVQSKDDQPREGPRENKGEDGSKKGEGDRDNEEAKASTPTPSPSPNSRSIRLIGPARDLTSSGMTVAGRKVVVSAQTRVQGTLRSGVPVEVLGREEAEDRILAASVTVLPNSPDRTPSVPQLP